MDDIRIRIRQALEWLKENRLFQSNRVIAERMGYNPSVLSQVITGKSAVTQRFVKSLCGVYPALSFEWIWNGEGTMIVESQSKQPEAAVPNPQIDRFSYLLSDMAEIMRNFTAMMVPLSERVNRLEQRIEAQARELEKLRRRLDERDTAATSLKK